MESFIIIAYHMIIYNLTILQFTISIFYSIIHVYISRLYIRRHMLSRMPWIRSHKAFEFVALLLKLNLDCFQLVCVFCGLGFAAYFWRIMIVNFDTIFTNKDHIIINFYINTLYVLS